MDAKLTKFLSLVRVTRWDRGVPSAWNEQLRDALSENFVRVGWGGVLELTDAGRAALRSEPQGGCPLTEEEAGLVDAALRQGTELVAPQGGCGAWRTMESAPRDGTEFIGYRRPSRNRRPIYFCKWSKLRECWVSTGDTPNAPTHWRPLPSPPEPCEPVNASKDGGAK